MERYRAGLNYQHCKKHCFVTFTVSLLQEAVRHLALTFLDPMEMTHFIYSLLYCYFQLTIALL